MKRIALFLLSSTLSVTAGEAPFHRGVNLTGWLQTSNARQIQFTRFTKQDFINIRTLGCDVIRLPINLHFMTSGAPDYTVDPLFFYFLDPIIDWSEELGMHLILDNHTFDPAADTPDNIGEALIPVWTQVASRYKDRSTLICYEILNEPHGITDSRWNAVQQTVIDAIRAVDAKHAIVVGPAGWNSYNNLALMPRFADDNLIYTFHFYDPFLFTHQGASWASPSMAPLAGVPFPFVAARMPACPPSLKGTWIESSLNGGYRTEGTVKHLKDLIDIAVRFRTQRNVPLFCGEFGVYIPNSPAADRVAWYDAVRSALEEKGIAWTIWDYQGGFGLFEKGSSELFDYDLNIPLVAALGLTEPPQKEFMLLPESAGFTLYDDFIGPGIIESGDAGDGLIDFYSETGPERGRNCILWTGAPRYTDIGFSFKPIRDLSRLVERGYALDFWVRGDSPGARFDVRFIDTKTEDPSDHPWRMRMTVDNTLASWDGEWKHLQIPLGRFTEQGSWDGSWYNPLGLFDWRAVDRFEIVSEHSDLKGVRFWFDDIRVLNPRGEETSRTGPLLQQNFPNPFGSSTRILFQNDGGGRVTIVIYDGTGRRIRTLFEGDPAAGPQAVQWDGLDDAGARVPGGVYLCRMKAAGIIRTRKVVFMH
jgi:endoglucanase